MFCMCVVSDGVVSGDGTVWGRGRGEEEDVTESSPQLHSLSSRRQRTHHCHERWWQEEEV